MDYFEGGVRIKCCTCPATLEVRATDEQEIATRARACLWGARNGGDRFVFDCPVCKNQPLRS